jgi:hypothetical protein
MAIIAPAKLCMLFPPKVNGLPDHSDSLSRVSMKARIRLKQTATNNLKA